MGKDEGVFVSEGALTVPGDEGHGVSLNLVLLARWEMREESILFE